MADGSTRAITPEECACFEDAEEVEACLEHVDDGCRWKIDLSGIAGVSPVSSCTSRIAIMIVMERAAAPREDTPRVSASGTALNSSLVSCMYGR